MVKEIKLTQGQKTLVDDEDYYFLNTNSWYAAYFPSINGYYAHRQGHNGVIKMHRLIINAKKGDIVGDFE